MWGDRNRVARLEQEVRLAAAERAALQRDLAFFKQIAEAVGLEMAGTAAVAPVPAGIVAAAARPAPAGTPVHLEIDGQEVVAVIGGGDPAELWPAIRRASARSHLAVVPDAS